MAQTTQTNRKKIMVPTTMSKSGWAIIEARDDVEGVEFVPTIPKAEFHKILEEASGICLGVQPFSDPELDAAPLLEVVSRIGVGYDAVDVPALTRRKVPLMIGGTSNSVSVAEAGVFLTMSLARKGAMMDTMVKEGRWHDRYKDMPVDLYAKTVLIVGFGYRPAVVNLQSVLIFVPLSFDQYYLRLVLAAMLGFGLLLGSVGSYLGVRRFLKQ